MSFSIISGELDAGPIVQTIFVLLIRAMLGQTSGGVKGGVKSGKWKMESGKRVVEERAVHTSRWQEKWAGKVRTPEDMVAFLDDVGCCTANEMLDYPDFPSQSAVLAEDAYDVWFWKDDLHAEKRLYYTRVFGGDPGFLSMQMLPAFVATNGATIDELAYEGLLSVEAQQIYRAIEDNGPIPIRDLKRMLTPEARRATDRVLHDLDRRFIISKTGITGRTRHSYGYIWDLTERWIPDVLEAADRLGRTRATEIIRAHLAAFGIPPDSPFYARVLGWTR